MRPPTYEIVARGLTVRSAGGRPRRRCSSVLAPRPHRVHIARLTFEGALRPSLGATLRCFPPAPRRPLSLRRGVVRRPIDIPARVRQARAEIDLLVTAEEFCLGVGIPTIIRLSTQEGTAGALPFRDFRGRAAQFATTSPVLLQSYTRCEG